MSETASPSSQQGYNGYMDPTDRSSPLNAQMLVIKKVLKDFQTAQLVQVTRVTNTGGLVAVGFVDVQPMVDQADGAGNATPHGVINNIPYFRLQGGTDAIIIDPKVGDIGVAVFCSRDISGVKRTKKRSTPGSFRRNDWADGLYIGGFLNGVPTQYIRYSSDGVEIVSPTKVKIQAPIVEVDGDFRSTGAVVAGFGGGDQVGLQTHKHGTGAAAAGTSVPTAGT